MSATITVLITGGSKKGQRFGVSNITESTTLLQFLERFLPTMNVALMVGSVCAEFLGRNNFIFKNKTVEISPDNGGKRIYEGTFGGSTNVTCFLELEEDGSRESNPTLRADVTESATVKVPFTKNAPDYRYCSPGLNMAGTCKNEKCVAKDKEVLCRHGFRTYSLGKDVSRCPKCNEIFQDSRPYFYECVVVYNGMKPNGGRFTEPNLVFEGNEAVTYQLMKGGVEVEYKYLIIDVRKKEDVITDPSTNTDMVVTKVCHICSKDLGKKEAFFPSFCGHMFHKECFDDWIKTTKLCPCCSSK